LNLTSHIYSQPPLPFHRLSRRFLLPHGERARREVEKRPLGSCQLSSVFFPSFIGVFPRGSLVYFLRIALSGRVSLTILVDLHFRRFFFGDTYTAYVLDLDPGHKSLTFERLLLPPCPPFFRPFELLLTFFSWSLCSRYACSFAPPVFTLLAPGLSGLFPPL